MVVGVLGIHDGATITSDQRKALGVSAGLIAIAVRNAQLFLATREFSLRDNLTHVRELIRRILARAGDEVVAVAGPHEALAALAHQPEIPLLLVDVVIPDMGGYDLVIEARQISPAIHVVFMSVFARDARRHPSSKKRWAAPECYDARRSLRVRSR